MRCQRCGASFSLGNLDAFRGDKSFAPELLESAALRLAMSAPPEGASGGVLIRHHRNLGLVFLNLARFDQALAEFRQVVLLRPRDAELRAVIQELERDFATAPARPKTADRADLGGRPEALNGPHPAIVESRPAVLPRQMEGNVRQFPMSRVGQPQPFVLVVDDSPTVRRLVTVTLERNGYEVKVAENGMEALAFLYDRPPDLILLDVTMPHLDGLKVCHVVTSVDSTRNIPVVFLSAKGGYHDKARGLRAGAVDHLTKPLEPARLLETL